MQYREIVAVTGLGGLFQLLASKQDGAIVRSLEDKSTRFVSSRIHNFTPLESIEVFTTGDNVNLAEVFKAMQEKETEFPLASAKADNNAIKAYFKKVYPDFDEEKVYVSDMKKMVKWYAILKANDLLKFDEILATEENGAETAEAEAAAPVAEAAATPAPAAEAEKPAKKAKAPKAAAKEKEEAAAEAPAEKEKPAKKATKAKKEETPAAEGEEAAPKKTTRKKKTEE
jgi:type IV secretory pathway VirJ component